MADVCARKMVTLKCMDGAVFDLEEGMALESEAIKQAIAESGGSNSAVELPEVGGDVLAVIIRYLELGKDSSAADKFAEELTHDPDLLFGVARGAYDLKIEPLVDLTCTTVAGMIAGKSPEEIQKAFKIDPDYAEAQTKRAKEEFPFFFEDDLDEVPKPPEKPVMSMEEIRAAKRQKIFAMRKKFQRAGTDD